MRALKYGLVPALLAVGALFAFGVNPAEILGKVEAKVRTEITRLELGRLAQIIRLDHDANGDMPPTEIESFSEFVRERTEARFGRDPSVDLWGRPYSLVSLDGDLYGIVSLGRDGIADRLCAAVAPGARSDSPEWDAGSDAGSAGEEPEPDDVCVVIELRRRQG
jgi:hypothetical protein